MSKFLSQTTDGKTSDSPLRLNYLSSGPSVTQADKESMALTSNGLLQIAAWETSAPPSEHSTPASSDYGAEDLSHPLKETPLQGEQNGSITISPQMEKPSLAMQTTSSQDYPPGFLKETKPSHIPATALGDEFFLIKNLASPLSVLMEPEAQMRVVHRAEHLSAFKQQGMHRFLLAFWEVVYLMDLLLFYTASRLEAFTSLLKLININVK